MGAVAWDSGYTMMRAACQFIADDVRSSRGSITPNAKRVYLAIACCHPAPPQSGTKCNLISEFADAVTLSMNACGKHRLSCSIERNVMPPEECHIPCHMPVPAT